VYSQPVSLHQAPIMDIYTQHLQQQQLQQLQQQQYYQQYQGMPECGMPLGAPANMGNGMAMMPMFVPGAGSYGYGAMPGANFAAMGAFSASGSPSAAFQAIAPTPPATPIKQTVSSNPSRRSSSSSAATPNTPRTHTRHHYQDIASPLRSDPAREYMRRTIQRKLRLRMLRKGQLPPNPTMEELQLAGLQPTSSMGMSPSGPGISYCYVQNPYDGSVQAVPYMTAATAAQFGIFASPPSPPTTVPVSSMRNHHQSYLATDMDQPRALTFAQHQQPDMQVAPYMQDFLAQCEAASIAEQQHQQQLQYQQQRQHESRRSSEQSTTSTLHYDSVYAQQQPEHPCAGLPEPFMLPEATQESQSAHFDSYFNTEYVLLDNAPAAAAKVEHEEQPEQQQEEQE